MTPTGAAILGYVLGLATATLLGAIYLLIRGGQTVRDHEPRSPPDRVARRRDW